MNLKGIHHVSAMTANAQNNYAFYTNVLGLRLIKKTVNQDDTSMYHLFYGDAKGNPGTELTFFEIPHLAKNHEGISSISAMSLRVATDASLTFWKKRLEEHHIKTEEMKERGGRLSLSFRDPEGQKLILVSDEQEEKEKNTQPWQHDEIPSSFAILGLGPVQLTVRYAEKTIKVLTELMNYRLKGHYPSDVPEQSEIIVLETALGGSDTEIHIEERKDLPVARLGRGGVHHVAFRVANEEELRQCIDKVDNYAMQNSGFVDRFYFKSLYFREKNGILFELATDGPGFDVDEQMEHLGETLALPPFLEHDRQTIEAKLKPLETKPLD